MSSFLVANHAAGDEDCRLRVEPDAGPTRTFLVPGNASTYTAVVNAGLHVQGTVSDGLGHAAPAGVDVEAYDEDGAAYDSWTETDAAGHYDLYVEPGSYTFDVYSASTPALSSYWLYTTPIDVSTDRSLDLAPVIDTLTVHARTPGGQPAPSSASLDCSGTPTGQTLIDWQSTHSRSVTGADHTLPGTATEDGSCHLSLDPDVGLSYNASVSLPDGGGETTVVVNPGITITGQVTVPGIATFTDATVTVQSSSSGDSATTAVAPNGSFTLTEAPPGAGTVYVDVNDATVGNFDFQRQVTLSEGDNLALAPDLDYLDLYLLGPTGDDGTGSRRLVCSGDNGDVNSFTSTSTTRSGTGLVRMPGYAGGPNSCSLTVTWADSTVVTRQVTLDPAVDTAVTLLRNGVTLQSDPFTSNDDDGVADALEAYAPNMGDGDSDGTPDYLQADVASLPEDGGALGSDEDYVTVAGPDGSEMFSVATDEVTGARMAWGGGSQEVTGPPDGTQLLRGFLDFEVRNVTPGSTRTVVIYYDSTAGMNSYSTYNPANGAWSQLPASRVKINPKSVELTLTDGGIGDVDGVANGRVRHPGAGSRVDDVYPVVSGRVLTPPNDKGWYDGNVTVRWTVTDDQPNIAAPPDTVVSAEGDDVTATSAQVCDKRGNCSTGSLQHLKIDKTPPAVTDRGPGGRSQLHVGRGPGATLRGHRPGRRGGAGRILRRDRLRRHQRGCGHRDGHRDRHRPGRQRQAEGSHLHRRVRRRRPGRASIRLEAEGVQAGLDGGRTAEDPRRRRSHRDPGEGSGVGQTGGEGQSHRQAEPAGQRRQAGQGLGPHQTRTVLGVPVGDGCGQEGQGLRDHRATRRRDQSHRHHRDQLTVGLTRPGPARPPSVVRARRGPRRGRTRRPGRTRLRR